MKKWISVLLALMLLMGLAAAGAEEAPEAAEEATRLRVGTTTPFSGNFFSEALGNNASDRDIRRLIYDYSPVYWNHDEGIYQLDDRIVDAALTNMSASTFILAMNRGLTYSDGTPITARDYAFSLLLRTSRELESAAGSRADGSMIRGFAAYDQGTAKALSGLRILGDYQLRLTINEEYLPYFYELKILDITPFPISVIAPGCEVKDDGEGAYIDGPFTAELLKETLLDPEKGYMSHPALTSGPYRMTEYDGSTVTLEANPNYTGDREGVKPQIEELTVQVVDSNNLINHLAQGEIDLAVRCLRNDQITAGLQLATTPDFSMASYVRNGLGFISFCAEKGPTASTAVRQGISLCVDKEPLVEKYTGGYGIQVDGYYGIGQWMYLMANGTLIPEEGDDAEAWNALNLDGLTRYPLDTDGAATLFELAGWNLNERGGAYNKSVGGLRYAEADGELKPLKLKLVYPEGNELGPILDSYFGMHLEQAGASLETEARPMPELLEMYYGIKERDCDMILLGTNFADVFDPSTDFDEEDRNRLNGITDSRLAELARDLRRTEPGQTVAYAQKWIAFQEYRTAQATEIPLYSNAYFDFFIINLRNYAPSVNSSWADAIVSAVISDAAPEEEEPEFDIEF